MKSMRLIAVFLFLFGLTGFQTMAQNDGGFIYGKITTVDDDEYVGQIRWGDEEAFWFDMFNSSKIDNEFVDLLSKKDYEKLTDEHSNKTEILGFIYINSDSHKSYTHSFVCMFGDIKKIKITGDDDVLLSFKNGEQIELSGASNDIGADVNIMDEELGHLGIDWDRISSVEFMQTPTSLKDKSGEPIYGTVYTEHGDEFTGYIQWDHDERLSIDVLDGETNDGDISVAFSKIKMIDKRGDGCKVILNSGKELSMDDSNDVDDGNRGIIVNIPDFGRVDVEWGDFEKLVIDNEHKGSGPAYNDFAIPKKLKGFVKTESGEKIEGNIIYDLDETWGFEILQGNIGDVEFLIPFRNINSIQPKNYKYSKVILNGGKGLLLGDSQDVSDDNYGILVETDKDEYRYIPIKSVDEVVFL
jgi:hypothetical protein